MILKCHVSLVLFAAVLLSFPVAGKSRKELREEARIDSIRVADSLRTREAKRIADSLNLLTYAEYARKKADRKEQEQLAKERAPSDTLSGAATSEESNGDIFAKREIVVPPGSEQERIVDSLDKEIAVVEAALYADRHFKKAKSYTDEGRIRLLKNLLKTGARSSSDIIGLTEKLLALHAMERQKLACILQTQEGNNRSFLMLHIKKIDGAAKPVSDFLARLMMTESPAAR